MSKIKKVKHNHVSQGIPKLQDVKFWSFYFKLWHLVTLMPLEVQGCVLPFWKPPINISKEPDCHGCCNALNVCQAMLKNCMRVSRLMHKTVLKCIPDKSFPSKEALHIFALSNFAYSIPKYWLTIFSNHFYG